MREVEQAPPALTREGQKGAVSVDVAGISARPKILDRTIAVPLRQTADFLRDRLPAVDGDIGQRRHKHAGASFSLNGELTHEPAFPPA
jgi:hypothetical protein